MSWFEWSRNYEFDDNLSERSHTKENSEISEEVSKLKEEFENIKAWKKYVWQQARILEGRLLREWDPQDKEYRELAEKINRLKKDLLVLWERWNQIEEELSNLLKEVQWEIRTLSNREIQALKHISNKEFLSIPKERRLQYVTKNCVDSQDISVWKVKNLEFCFTFDWEFNRDLYLKTTAWQVLPVEVWSVISEWKIYYRSNIEWEFFTENNERLIIHDWTQIEIWKLRTKEDLEEISKNNQQKLEDYLKDNPDANKDIVFEAIKRWIDPKFASLVFGDLIKDLGEKQAKIVLEDAFSEFDRVRWELGYDLKSQNWEYDSNFVLTLLNNLFWDKFWEIALKLWLKSEEIETFKKISDWKIDFSSIESWDIKWMIEKTAIELWVNPKIIEAILRQESNWNMWATRFEKHVYFRELRKWTSPSEAKLLATSFWWFQIMGFNYKTCWYNSVFDFVEAMKEPKNQFEAFSRFIKSNSRLHNAMKWNNPDFQKIAYYYNWPKYAENSYDTNIRKYFYA